MSDPTKLETLLVMEEGVILHEYKDHLGYSTIGVGRLIDKRRGGGISHDEALMLLRNDIAAKAKELDAAIPWWRGLDQTRATVIQAMAFQLGVPGLLGFAGTLNAIRNGNWKAAAAGMRASLWYEQTPQRAERMAVAMEIGVL